LLIAGALFLISLLLVLCAVSLAFPIKIQSFFCRSLQKTRAAVSEPDFSFWDGFSFAAAGDTIYRIGRKGH
jgi:hypothetical protein